MDVIRYLPIPPRRLFHLTTGEAILTIDQPSIFDYSEIQGNNKDNLEDPVIVAKSKGKTMTAFCSVRWLR